MFVRQFLDVPPPPEEFKRAMILRAIQGERRCGWRAYLPVTARLRDFTMGMATAAVLALALYGVLPELWSNPDIQKVVREASLTYGIHTTQHMPLGVESADDTAVTQWLNTHMGHHIKLPCITDKAAQLLGGRVCRILDRKSAVLVYEHRGVPIMLFAFYEDRMSLPAKQRPQHISGRSVVMWQRDKVVYSMVGDMHSDDLMKVAATINYR